MNTNALKVILNALCAQVVENAVNEIDSGAEVFSVLSGLGDSIQDSLSQLISVPQVEIQTVETAPETETAPVPVQTVSQAS